MSSTKTQPEIKEPNAVVRYYRETVGELRKVVWPTRQEAFNLTAIVLGVIVVGSLFLGAFDYIFGEMIRLLINLRAG